MFETVMKRVRNNYNAEMEMAVKSYLVICPVCGSRHSAHERCALCALNSAFDGTYTQV